jgi:hypothetical protein
MLILHHKPALNVIVHALFVPVPLKMTVQLAALTSLCTSQVHVFLNALQLTTRIVQIPVFLAAQIVIVAALILSV